MEYYWWGIILLIIIIIVTIIVFVVLNHGNILNIIEQLPVYRIYYPAGNMYVGLFNIDVLPRPPPYPIDTQVWYPIITVSPSPLLNQWQFILPSTMTFDTTLQPNQRLVKMLNVIYNAVNNGYTVCPSGGGINCTQPNNINIGYVSYDPSTTGILEPNYTLQQALTFIYTTTSENKFTLTTEDGFIAVVDNILRFIKKDNPNLHVSEFQLIPL